MENYILSCCSTVDLKKQHLEKLNVPYICFHYDMDGITQKDDLWISESAQNFYDKIDKGSVSKTTQVNTSEFIAFFEPFLKEGKDIIHLSLSGALSGTVNSANMAVAMLKEKYPMRKIYIIDTLAASSGYGLLVDYVANKKNEGLSIQELRDYAENIKLKVNHWFFSTTLKFFVRGGRISRASGFFGTALKICPLMNVSFEGKLIPRQKIRTKKKVIEEIVNKMVELADNKLEYNGKCYISHSSCYDDAKAVADLVEEKFKNLDGSVVINDIGATIGSHTGPGTVALFFMGEKRID